LEWIETELDSPLQQFNFYDQEKEVGMAIEMGAEWFKTKL